MVASGAAGYTEVRVTSQKSSSLQLFRSRIRRLGIEKRPGEVVVESGENAICAGVDLSPDHHSSCGVEYSHCHPDTEPGSRPAESALGRPSARIWERKCRRANLEFWSQTPVRVAQVAFLGSQKYYSIEPERA
jgi:hypothetical protein